VRARWQLADQRRRQLEEAEAHWTRTLAGGEADAMVSPLPANLDPLLAEVRADPVFQRAFATVTTRIGVVRLDPLIVYQRSINLEHVERLKQQLGTSPSPEELFRFCLPADHPTPPVRVRAIKDDAFAFVSESTDLRFLEPILLQGDQVADYQPLGPVAGIVGLTVGFGSNYVNVIECEGRFVLNNGNHRIYALRELGVTHAPCVIQQAERHEDLRLIAGGRLRRDPDAYLRHVRPPLLRDYFDEKLSCRVRLMRKSRVVRVNFTIEEISL